MLFKKKRKCSTKTMKIISDEKRKVMSKTLEYLKELRETFEQKQIA